MFEKVMDLYRAGYQVVVGSYYGDDVIESEEDLVDLFDEVAEDEWLHLSLSKVDDKQKEVYLYEDCDC